MGSESGVPTEPTAADRKVIEFVNDELRTYILPEQIVKLRAIFLAEIWEGSEPAKRFSPEGHSHMFDHKELCYWIRESEAARWVR